MKDVPFVQGSRPMISNVSVLHWIAIYRLINTLTWCVKARHTISVLYVISEPVLITFDMAIKNCRTCHCRFEVELLQQPVSWYDLDQTEQRIQKSLARVVTGKLPC